MAFGKLDFHDARFDGHLVLIALSKIFDEVFDAPHICRKVSDQERAGEAIQRILSLRRKEAFP